MSIRHFVPSAIAVIAAVGWLADQLGVPVVPLAVISTIGAVMVALQLEDHKLGDFVAELLHPHRHDGLKH